MEFEACKGHSALSPALSYNDLSIRSNELERQRLIAAAEMEIISSGTSDRAMNPTVYLSSPGHSPRQVSDQFGPRDLPTEKWKVFSRSLSPTIMCPLSATSLSLDRNRKKQQLQGQAHTAVVRQTEIESGLRHPFMTSLARSHSKTISHYSHNHSPDLADKGCNKQNVNVEPSRLDVIEAAESPILIPEINQEASNPMADGQSPPSEPKANPVGGLRSLKRNQIQTPLEQDRRASKRLRFEGDVFDLPSSPEPDQNLRQSFSTAPTAINSKLGSPKLQAPM